MLIYGERVYRSPLLITDHPPGRSGSAERKVSLQHQSHNWCLMQEAAAMPTEATDALIFSHQSAASAARATAIFWADREVQDFSEGTEFNWYKCLTTNVCRVEKTPNVMKNQDDVNSEKKKWASVLSWRETVKMQQKDSSCNNYGKCRQGWYFSTNLPLFLVEFMNSYLHIFII